MTVFTLGRSESSSKLQSVGVGARPTKNVYVRRALTTPARVHRSAVERGGGEEPVGVAPAGPGSEWPQRAQVSSLRHGVSHRQALARPGMRDRAIAEVDWLLSMPGANREQELVQEGAPLKR